MNIGHAIAVALGLLAGVVIGAGIMYVGMRMGGRIVWRALGIEGDPLQETKAPAIDQEEAD